MTEPIEESAPIVVDAEPVAPVGMLRRPASFLRRFFAFAIDGFILGIGMQVPALAFASLWYEIGPYGRLVGLFFGLAYFGLLNSRLGGGRTVGKRMLGITVVDGAGEPIGLGRSVLRSLIVLLPITLNGWSLPILGSPVGGWLVTVLLFGVGGCLLFTMIFNVSTRQGLHDMLCGTYVVRTSGERIAAFPLGGRVGWRAVAIIFGLAMVMPFIAMTLVKKIAGNRLEPMMTFYKVLERDPRFFSAGVNDQSFSASGRKTVRTLNITVWQKGNPSEEVREKTTRDLAKQALESVPDINGFDNMRISITTGYDLGIASGYSAYNAQQTIPVWRQKVASPVIRGPAQ